MFTVLEAFVPEDHGLLCIDIEVSSPVHNTAWIRMSCGVTQWVRQSSESAPEFAGTDTVLINEGTAVAHAQPEDTDLCIWRPIAFHPEITPS